MHLKDKLVPLLCKGQLLASSNNWDDVSTSIMNHKESYSTKDVSPGLMRKYYNLEFAS